jgi:uncharacterized damage-inducible protein DinB
MTWTAPDIDRTWPQRIAGEREALESWLDYHRRTLLTKCAGLTAEQLRERACPPSPLTLHGLVRHMAEVERNWFRRQIPNVDLPPIYGALHDDADWLGIDDADFVADVAILAEEIEEGRKVVAERGLDERFTHRRHGDEFDVRWVYIHMIEEYARHNGHADFLRERIDGVTGG